MSEAPKLAPSILVIFGITGDLAKRKVLPALYHLTKDNLIPEGTKIIGISRRETPIQNVLNTVDLCIQEEGNICDPVVISRLNKMLSMFKLDPLIESDYNGLKTYLDKIELESGLCLDRLFYLSIPPQVYNQVIERLGNSGLNRSCVHSDNNPAKVRLLVEKPFGFDVPTAEELIANTSKVFSESQTFRIDHYLAKETAQNILKFRRHNPLFASQWDGRHISAIHVIAKEKIGIENRVNFYEQVGALRDLVQSHLLQLLSLTAMDMPENLTAKEVHAAKLAFMSNLVPPSDGVGIKYQARRGQYRTYRKEVSNPHSTVETFASIVLRSRDPNWNGALFQLTTGKSLDEKVTIIKVYFGDENPNVFSFRIQPDEGVDIDLLIEQPGFKRDLRKVKMTFRYEQDFGDSSNHQAYERVLVDAIRGDHLLFATKEEVMASWHLLQPVISRWEADSKDLEMYDNGSAGPDVSRMPKAFMTKLKAGGKISQ
jgi:glucose-6-phosphate 1-dehydrogenase